MEKVLKKEVLVEVENHCQKVSVNEEDYQGVTDTIQSLLSELFPGKSRPFFLQLFDNDYKCFVDFCPRDCIANKSTIKVLWQSMEQVCYSILASIG